RRRRDRPASRSSTSFLRTRGSPQPLHCRCASRTPDPPPSPSGPLLRPLGVRADKSSAVLETRVDATRDEGSVVADESDERRPPGVLPGEPDEEHAGRVGNPAPMDDAAALVLDRWDIDPSEVGAVPRRPDDRVDLLLAPVLEDGAPPHSAREPLPQPHARL